MGLVAQTSSLLAEDNAPPPPPQGEHAKGPRGPMTPEAYIQRIEKAVGPLTTEQKTKITDILADTKKKMESVKPDEGREKFRELMQAQQAAVRAVLTAEQQTKFDAMPRPGPRGKRPE
ncbi:hypothetical protein DB354_04055 [Opitutus sp. ER46]|nr:hypothetical protein DB354_04055 [Opitutus sp. ER46]